MSLTEEAFCERHPTPVLLFSNVHAGSMTPVKKTRTPTVDRLIVGETPRDGARSVGPTDWYVVFDLVSKTPATARISLGCSSSCDVRLDDASISRVHAWVTATSHGHYLEDADSSAGTAINGSTLEQSQIVQLKSGDRISLGNVDLVFLPSADFYTFVRRLSGFWGG